MPLSLRYFQGLRVIIEMIRNFRMDSSYYIHIIKQLYGLIHVIMSRPGLVFCRFIHNQRDFFSFLSYLKNYVRDHKTNSSLSFYFFLQIQVF